MHYLVNPRGVPINRQIWVRGLIGTPLLLTFYSGLVVTFHLSSLTQVHLFIRISGHIITCIKIDWRFFFQFLFANPEKNSITTIFKKFLRGTIIQGIWSFNSIFQQFDPQKNKLKFLNWQHTKCIFLSRAHSLHWKWSCISRTLGDDMLAARCLVLNSYLIDWYFSVHFTTKIGDVKLSTNVVYGRTLGL